MPAPRPSHHPNADVRMRGFASRATVEAAIAWIDSVLPPFEKLPTESVSLWQAAGRVLAKTVVSGVNVPSFPRSMMDGYAVRADETQGATSYNRLALRVVATCLPGTRFTGQMGPGDAVRIMTGAPLPPDADAVIPVEVTEGDKDHVWLMDAVAQGKNVGQIGEDVCLGGNVCESGRLLRPQDLGVLSSIGCGQVEVIRPPHVRILITGNELLPAGTPPAGDRIADANGPMLAALVQRDGGTVVFQDHVADDPDQLRAALMSPGDVVLVSGGSSVGQEDHVPRLLAEAGELAIHGIAMRPSSPTGMGRIGETQVFLLPGNPVSCLCAYDFFAGRAIRSLAGRSRDWPYRRMHGKLTRKLVSTVGRVDYARVMVRGDEVEPLAISGAAVLSSTTRADGFVITPADSEGYPAGAEVEVILYDAPVSIS